ncbi:HNH endonuclease [Pectobacterium versatile]|uniref:HNH endonuclease n=1 Tax=Pectobacterium TaxID=122277 RepID=UPI000B7BF579|nr:MULTISPECIES: HNH endonuclease [Pectobacterium]ASN87072.1 HNH endonuclease [Pectobacterium versatile]
MINQNEMSDVVATLFAVDSESESGLIWKYAIAKRVKIGACAGTLGKDGYWAVQLKGKKYAVHRIVWYLTNGAIPDGYCIDHADGDRGNNSILNLRLATRAQNSQNARKFMTHNDLPKGVSVNKVSGVYCAQVQVNGKRWRKHGKNLEQLTQELQLARTNSHGQFACHG